MLLTIDVGNTNTSFCVFENNKIVDRFSVSSDIKKTSDEYGAIIFGILSQKKLSEKIKNVAISSVVLPLDDILDEAIKKYLKISAFKITHKINLPFNIAIDSPKELGADRIANAAYAVKNIKLPAIVIDFGTATTFDIIDENKCFIGGLIAPGVKIQAQSLTKFTSKLPKLKVESAKTAIAKNTIDAMLAGVVLGHSCMIDGMLELTEKELGQKSTVVACGGYSEILYSKVKRKFDFIEKDLTHLGIKYLWEFNHV